MLNQLIITRTKMFQQEKILHFLHKNFFDNIHFLIFSSMKKIAYEFLCYLNIGSYDLLKKKRIFFAQITFISHIEIQQYMTS